MSISSGTDWSLIDGLGAIVSKNVFPTITLKRVLVETEQNGPSFLKRKPTVPSSESRAEKFNPFSLRDLCTNVFLSIACETSLRVANLRGIVAKRRKWERVFMKHTEQSGPLVLRWNQLFRVPNSERNNLVLYVRFGNYCS